MKITYIIAALIVLAGGLWYFVDQSGPSSSTATSTPPMATTASPQPNKVSSPAPKTGTKTAWAMQGVNSLNALLGQKLNVTCAITSGGRAGTLSVSGTEARIDFADASMIDDGNNLYVWSGTGGVRVAAALTASGSVAASRGGIDPAAPFKYGCNTATVAQSLFTPPSTVRFVDGAGNPI